MRSLAFWELYKRTAWLIIFSVGFLSEAPRNEKLLDTTSATLC